MQKKKVKIVTRLVLQRGLMFQVKVLRQRETWQLWRRAFAQNIKRLYNKYLTTWQYTNLVTCYGCILQIFGGTPTPKLWPWTHSGFWQPCLVNSEWLFILSLINLPCEWHHWHVKELTLGQRNRGFSLPSTETEIWNYHMNFSLFKIIFIIGRFSTSGLSNILFTSFAQRLHTF